MYLLMGSVDYEGSEPVLAFHDESLANEWLEKANEWLSIKPTLFIDDESGWDKYDTEYKQWSESVPELAKSTLADGFYLTTIQVKGE